MLFNSRSVSFLLSSIVGIITSFSLAFIGDPHYSVITIGFFASFVSSFALSFLILEMLIFRELRNIYQLFDSLSGHKLKLHQDANVPIKKISRELYTFAYAKQYEIEQLKKIEEIRRSFLADISHELKTPVFAAQGFIHTLLDGAMEDKKVRTRFLKKAAKSLDNLDTLVQDLIIITQVETGEARMEMEEFDLCLLIKEVFDNLERKAKKRNASLTLLTELEGIEVVGDRYRIGQVITNLVENAIKYGNENGHVEVILKENETNMEIKIKDDGPGISEEHQKGIFQRFYRIDKSRSRETGGSGLGLSIVKHILEVHESSIEVESTLGKGTTFAFHLKKVVSLEKSIAS